MNGVACDESLCYYDDVGRTGTEIVKPARRNMTDLHVLVPGYYTIEAGIVCSTITLINDNGTRCLVDPGSVPKQSDIVTALARHNLTPDDIDVVFITHSHLDHYRNLGLFPRAQAIDYWGYWNGHAYRYNTMSRKFSDNIFIQTTPGHSDDNITLFVTTGDGVYAVCGDVFWDRNGPPADRFANDNDQLQKSRRIILDRADFVVPGHGDIFAVSEVQVSL